MVNLPSKNKNINIIFEDLEPIYYFKIKLVVPEQVYGPMEDTDLSIRFLRDWILKCPKNNYSSKPLRILEMGTGTGILSLYLIDRLSKNNIVIYHNGVDINPIAVKTARYNANLNNLSQYTHFKKGNLFEPLISPIETKPYNLIIFNPPYLASDKNIIDDNNRQWIDLAWEGGNQGYEVTMEFLKQMSPFLASDGEIMFISSSRVNQSPLFKELSRLKLKILKKYSQQVFFETITLYHCKSQ